MKTFLAIAAITFNSILTMAQINWHDNPIGAVFARQSGETPEGTFRLINDGYEVITLVSADKSFQPASLFYGENNADKSKVDEMAPDGKVATGMNCFIVNTPDGYIMIDTGLPEAKGGKTIERMTSLKISPDDIKAVFITHAHFDHIGGLLDDDGKAVYQNAEIYMPAAEQAYITETMQETARQLADAYHDRFTVFDQGEILPYNILPISAKGHTPGHTTYRLGNLLFAGDLMHGVALQLPDPTICASYDADRAQAIATRISLLSYAAANSLTLLCSHVPINGVVF